VASVTTPSRKPEFWAEVERLNKQDAKAAKKAEPVPKAATKGVRRKGDTPRPPAPSSTALHLRAIEATKATLRTATKKAPAKKAPTKKGRK
jgi:hypothetical protein